MNEGDKTSSGWRGKKYYLSDEAVALLEAHCKSTTYPGSQRHISMSAYIDMLIKQNLGSARNKKTVPELPSVAAEARAKKAARDRDVVDAVRAALARRGVTEKAALDRGIEQVRRAVPGTAADVPRADRITTAAKKDQPFDL